MRNAEDEDLEKLMLLDDDSDPPDPASAPLQLKLPRSVGGYLSGTILGNVLFPVICSLGVYLLFLFYKAYIVGEPVGKRDTAPVFDQWSGKCLLYSNKKITSSKKSRTKQQYDSRCLLGLIL